jgi:hypothetical protein
VHDPLAFMSGRAQVEPISLCFRPTHLARPGWLDISTSMNSGELSPLPWLLFHGGPMDHHGGFGPRDHEPDTLSFQLKNNSKILESYK